MVIDRKHKACDTDSDGSVVLFWCWQQQGWVRVCEVDLGLWLYMITRPDKQWENGNMKTLGNKHVKSIEVKPNMASKQWVIRNTCTQLWKGIGMPKLLVKDSIWPYLITLSPLFEPLSSIILRACLTEWYSLKTPNWIQALLSSYEWDMGSWKV